MKGLENMVAAALENAGLPSMDEMRAVIANIKPLVDTGTAALGNITARVNAMQESQARTERLVLELDRKMDLILRMVDPDMVPQSGTLINENGECVISSQLMLEGQITNGE